MLNISWITNSTVHARARIKSNDYAYLINIVTLKPLKHYIVFVIHLHKKVCSTICWSAVLNISFHTVEYQLQKRKKVDLCYRYTNADIKVNYLAGHTKKHMAKKWMINVSLHCIIIFVLTTYLPFLLREMNEWQWTQYQT